MESRYKIVISNKNLYKEIELPPEAQEIKLGTGVDCDVRLHRSFFFDRIELVFTKTGNEWSVVCSDNLYLTVGDIRKLMTKNLKHGDSLIVKYQNSDNEVFSFDFIIDFDNGKTKYERIIDLSGISAFSIGSAATSNIAISSSYVNGDAIEITKKDDNLQLLIKHSNYGVYHNGNRIENRAEIKNGDFFSISDFFFYFKHDTLWAEIRNDMRVNALKYRDMPVPNYYPVFVRNTRIKPVINDEKIEILDPPAKPQKPKNNLFMKLLPSFGMLIAAGVMAFFGGMMIIMSAISGLMSIFTAIMSIRESNKDYKEASAERIEKYNAYVSKKKAEIQSYRDQEHRELEELYVSQEIEENRFNSFSPDLFDRSPEDDDFLCVCLGSGDVESKREINYKKQEKLDVDDELQQIPEEICNEFKNVHGAPIVCDLKEINAIGVVGAPNFRFEFLKNIIIDIAARQFFSDVKMIFVVKNEHKDRIQWLRYLPHVYNDDIHVRNIVCDDESKNLIFEYLYKELTIREQNKTYENNIIVFFYDEYGFKSHPVSKFVDKAKELGVTFVFFGNTTAEIPQGCGYIVSISDGKNATLINAQNKSRSISFVYNTISNKQARDIVKLLAPVYTEEISLEGTLTKNITLFELLNIIAVDDIALQSRWENSQVTKSMAAPIGVSKTGVVYLDLHDKAHGPHGLVAGTTGSGKSEILQTYILSMATLFHPYEVGFVIIDFKGGGMVNQFKDLPHLMGAITNIDGKEIDRSLKSIKAELQKRQRLFAEAEVNHIDKYILKYKKGEVEIPLPHLILIVDEFAELKAEQPEFMKELISAARIGRSLGVHLILATQKPSGQVNEQIWSNSKFKLCLKVQSQEDSNEVIKSPLAAEIKEPGRAYLQVGNNEIFELFQSAYSGASEKTDDSKVKEFSIYSLTDSGKRVPVYVQKKRKTGEGSSTQLDAIVRYISSYCKDGQIKKLPDICLPSLSTHIPFPEQEYIGNSTSNITADIGIYDDPDNQYQGQFTIDLTNQNVMIIGSSQSGKTNLLQDIIRSISTKYTPKEVCIYIIDFASMVLKTYEKLNHVGGVVTSSEDEKLKNLMKLLKTEIETRKERLLSVGVSSFSAYKEAGRDDLPQIVLLIDNLTALKELYFQDDDELLNLCREGLSVGISIVIANAQTAGIGYKYLSNFSAKIALFCNDSSEYSSLFDHCRETIDDIHGRCIVEIDKTHLDCQTFLAFEGEKEIDRVKAIKEYIAKINAKNAKMFANIIPVIPDLLTRQFVDTQYGFAIKNPYDLVIGLNYGNVSPFVLNLANVGVLAITGREKSGRSNFIRYMLSTMQNRNSNNVDVYVIDNVERKLASVQDNSIVKSYSVIAETAVETIINIEDELKLRYEALVSGDENIINNSNLIIFIINNIDAIENISNNAKALEAYMNIKIRYKNMNVCIIAGDYPNTNISYSSPEIIRSLRDAKHFLYFDDIDSMKVIDLPLTIVRQFKKPIMVGDCYYFNDNNCYKIKSVLS